MSMAGQSKFPASKIEAEPLYLLGSMHVLIHLKIQGWSGSMMSNKT